MENPNEDKKDQATGQGGRVMSEWFKVSGREEHWVNLSRIDYITASRNERGRFDVTFWCYGSAQPAELLYDLNEGEMAQLRNALKEDGDE